MECHHRIEVPLRSGGGKKMKKRRELDALIAHSLTKRGVRRTVQSQDKLLSVSTDDPDEYTWVIEKLIYYNIYVFVHVNQSEFKYSY